MAIRADQTVAATQSRRLGTIQRKFNKIKLKRPQIDGKSKGA
jgi:hypothetical protein